MVYVAVLEREVELALVPSESQQNNRVLPLTVQTDDTNEKGIVLFQKSARRRRQIRRRCRCSGSVMRASLWSLVTTR